MDRDVLVMLPPPIPPHPAHNPQHPLCNNCNKKWSAIVIADLNDVHIVSVNENVSRFLVSGNVINVGGAIVNERKRIKSVSIRRSGRDEVEVRCRVVA